MPLSHDIDNPDSLNIILQKTKAIKNINQENLAHIQAQARKGQKVVSLHKVNLQTNLPTHTKSVSDNENLVALVENSSTIDITSIIENWRYDGEVLSKETIAIDYFIDLKLDRFDDLIRLHDTYDSLLENYSQVLSDNSKSRRAASIVLRNLEILQVAVGNIHEQTFDIVDVKKMNDEMKNLVEHISSGFRSVFSKMSDSSINLNANNKLLETVN